MGGISPSHCGAMILLINEQREDDLRVCSCSATCRMFAPLPSDVFWILSASLVSVRALGVSSLASGLLIWRGFKSPLCSGAWRNRTEVLYSGCNIGYMPSISLIAPSSRWHRCAGNLVKRPILPINPLNLGAKIYRGICGPRRYLQGSCGFIFWLRNSFWWCPTPGMAHQLLVKISKQYF